MDTFKALQIVKSAFQNGIINVSEEVATHMAAEWDFGGLIDVEESSEPVWFYIIVGWLRIVHAFLEPRITVDGQILKQSLLLQGEPEFGQVENAKSQWILAVALLYSTKQSCPHTLPLPQLLPHPSFLPSGLLLSSSSSLLS